MKPLIVSDIHANPEALHTALAESHDELWDGRISPRRLDRESIFASPRHPALGLENGVPGKKPH